MDLPFNDHSEQAELHQLAAESMGWQPLTDGAYLHHGDKENQPTELAIQVVGIPDIALAGQNVLLLT
jgi:hypothetical protein